MIEFSLYRLMTIGWANSVLHPTVPLLGEDLPDELLVDLSKLSFIDAFGVTYLAACFARCARGDRKAWVRPPRDPRVNNYLQDVGLYTAIGLGDRFRARHQSLDRVDLVHISALSPGFVDHLLDFLERIQPFAEGVRPSIRLAIIELIQNFAEHSGSAEGAWIAGQLYPRRGSPRVTVCVTDFGIGIPAHLRHGQPKAFGKASDE